MTLPVACWYRLRESRLPQHCQARQAEVSRQPRSGWLRPLAARTSTGRTLLRQCPPGFGSLRRVDYNTKKKGSTTVLPFSLLVPPTGIEPMIWP